ncbi:MAG: delta-60 repeat domain-containing protein [Deltaproteobacteria bacterium]|nr:delta-60 repeat domain-containing protein [Deltaproteobacteria bacterium]MBI3296476.1 delta-60 repeat domain-containing protein [Deltaproteobacteria bacterium]
MSIPVNPALFVGGALALANAPANGQAGNAGDDGSVYVVTDGGGWKLKPDGTIDTAYGVDGYRGDSAWQDNLTRKLTAVWESNDQLLIIKDSYESPLRRVTSQAGAGTNFPELYQALQEGGRKGFVTRVLRKSDGRLLVSGYSEEPSTHTFRLLQLLPSGSIDPAFSFWGLPLSSFNLIYDCRLGANERWLMASVGSGNLTICSLSTTGLPDDGCQTFSIGAQSAFEPPLIVSDNRILIVESPMAPPFERKVYLRAFQLNGNADLTFGDNGTSIFKAEQLFTGSSMSTCAINQFQVLGSAKIADGSLLLALRGQNTTPFCRKGAFLKLDSAGKPDMTFGRDGLRVLEIDDHYMYSVGWAVISR